MHEDFKEQGATKDPTPPGLPEPLAQATELTFIFSDGNARESRTDGSARADLETSALRPS